MIQTSIAISSAIDSMWSRLYSDVVKDVSMTSCVLPYAALATFYLNDAWRKTNLLCIRDAFIIY